MQEQELKKCEDHQKSPISYCVIHSQLICLKCIQENHQKCTLKEEQDIENDFKNLLSQINDLILKAEKLKNLCKKDHSFIHTFFPLDNLFSCLKKRLEIKEEKYLKEITNRMQEKRNELEKFKNNTNIESFGTSEIQKKIKAKITFIQNIKSSTEELIRKKLIYKKNFRFKINLKEVIPQIFVEKFYGEFGGNQDKYFPHEFKKLNSKWEITMGKKETIKNYYYIELKRKPNDSGRGGDQVNNNGNFNFVVVFSIKRGTKLNKKIEPQIFNGKENTFTYLYFIEENKIAIGVPYLITAKIRFLNYQDYIYYYGIDYLPRIRGQPGDKDIFLDCNALARKIPKVEKGVNNTLKFGFL